MDWLATVEFSYNDKKHVATGKTPFKLNFGRHSWKGDLMIQMGIPQVEELMMHLQKSWEHTVYAMKEAQKSMKR